MINSSKGASFQKDDGTPEEILRSVLSKALEQFHSETGTIHRLDAPAQLLHLVAQAGLSPQMLDIVKTIPVGKGISGETAQNNRPVTICNLQTDPSGGAKPGGNQRPAGHRQ
jgi:signal transduction protein with GAF and PtsI domain